MAMTVAAMTTSAQVVLWDGEDKNPGDDSGFWNRADPTVVEEADGNKCLQVTLKANPDGWDKEHCNAALPLGDVDFKSLRRLTMRIKMGINHNVLVRLVKDGDGGYSTGRLFWCGDADQWNILTFEFAAGPDCERITDTGNTVLEIWPFEDGGDALNNVGQTILIDDIKMEGAMVDGKGLLAYDDNSLTGEVVVTGVLGKGNYQCTWNGDWHPEAYDDYALLAAKLELEHTWATTVYNGLWYSPLRKALSAFVTETQKNVTGTVNLKLYKGNVIKAGIWSPNSLYSEEIATFGESDYNQADATGFINLWGLPTKVQAMLDQGLLNK